MRGSPLLRALIAFLILLLLGWPLWRLTHEAAEQAAAAGPLPAPEEVLLKEIKLQLAFTTAPGSVKILHLGKELWSQAAPPQEIEIALRLPYPGKGIELQFEIAWPGDALAAMRAHLTDPAGDEHEKTVWGKGAVTEVLAFP